MSLRIADRWFSLRRIDDDITLLWEPYVIPLMRCNIWHVRGRDRDLVIDTGLGVASLREAARDILGKKVTAVATHTHNDHIGGHHEFEDCIVHRSEAWALAHPGAGALSFSGMDPDYVRYLNDAGYDVDPDGLLITALPNAAYELDDYCVKPAPATWVVEDGDRVDLGNRNFEVLHLPGHSPGSIGLFEAASGVFFSGDCVYDGPLLDGLRDSDIPDYLASMKRLRDLPVRVVHGGHDPSFGRDRLHELIDAYLQLRE